MVCFMSLMRIQLCNLSLQVVSLEERRLMVHTTRRVTLQPCLSNITTRIPTWANRTSTHIVREVLRR